MALRLGRTPSVRSGVRSGALAFLLLLQSATCQYDTGGGDYEYYQEDQGGGGGGSTPGRGNIKLPPGSAVCTCCTRSRVDIGHASTRSQQDGERPTAGQVCSVQMPTLLRSADKACVTGSKYRC
eukprot:3682661-Rhodomonas_salina.2